MAEARDSLRLQVPDHGFKGGQTMSYGFVSSLILLNDIGVLSFPSEYNEEMGGGRWAVCAGKGRSLMS